MASQDWFEKDFYATLGVPSDASDDAIKKAYRKLARTHHPDANAGDAKAEQKFKEIGEAYAVLSDAEQRQQYDAIRTMARGGPRFTAGGAGGPGNGAGFEDIFGGLFGQGGAGGRGGNVRFDTGRGGAGPDFDLNDLLGDLFAQQGGGGQYRSPRAPSRGADLAAEVNLSFKQAMEGSQLDLRVEDPRAGVRTVSARVPAGVKDGQKVRVRGKGRPSDMGAEPGDLVITVHVEPHPVFAVDGDNIRITVPVTFAEAVFGGTIEVPTPQGGVIKMKVAPGTPSGRVLRAKGRGVKTAKATGDLLVTLQVAVPQRLDDAARQALQEFADATNEADPRADLIARAKL